MVAISPPFPQYEEYTVLLENQVIKLARHMSLLSKPNRYRKIAVVSASQTEVPYGAGGPFWIFPKIPLSQTVMATRA